VGCESQPIAGDGFEVVTFGQGFKDMTTPAKEWEKLVISGKLRHGGNPVLRWMASVVAVETDAAGNIKPSKKKSTDRIDRIVAGVMALGRAMMGPRHQRENRIRTERPLLSSNFQSHART
jgi:phage terminase large subunit-like protein